MHCIDNLGLVEGEEIKLKYVSRCVGFRRAFLLKATKPLCPNPKRGMFAGIPNARVVSKTGIYDKGATLKHPQDALLF
jgi:hypothetical protein